jgi:hypothetical protein
MEKEFVPYELALELKQLGFDEKCFSFYDKYEDLYESEGYYSYKDNVCSDEVVAPLYQQAFRWFREKYKVRFFIESGMSSNWGEFFKVIFPDGEQRGMSYITYEEAELACLKKLIEIVKEKK